jgi:hypothetical protein
MKLLNDLIAHLNIRFPVTITIKTRKGKDCDGLYLPHYSDRTGKLIGHKITIYTVGNTRSFETLLAHELIHAWQEEKRVAEFHGPFFAEMAKIIERDFGIKEIYLQEIDE